MCSNPNLNSSPNPNPNPNPNQVHRVLRPGGCVAVAFSNRCFESKAVALWMRKVTANPDPNPNPNPSPNINPNPNPNPNPNLDPNPTPNPSPNPNPNPNSNPNPNPIPSPSPSPNPNQGGRRRGAGGGRLQLYPLRRSGWLGPHLLRGHQPEPRLWRPAVARRCHQEVSGYDDRCFHQTEHARRRSRAAASVLRAGVCVCCARAVCAARACVALLDGRALSHRSVRVSGSAVLAGRLATAETA